MWLRRTPSVVLDHEVIRGMTITIPGIAIRGLEALAEQSDDVVDRLAVVLERTPPAGSVDKLADDVAAGYSELSAPLIRSIVRSLVNLHYGMEFYSLGAAEFCREVCVSLRGDDSFQPTTEW